MPNPFPHTPVLTSPLTAGVCLPERDIRHAGDETVFRHWAEMSRRAARVGVLLVTDTIAGLLGVLTALGTWDVVSNDGLRPLPRALPMIAMVFCIQPLALCAIGAYRGGRARRSLPRIAAALLITATASWVQARIFGQMTPDMPNRTAYLYSTLLIAIYMWPLRVAVHSLIQFGYRTGWLQRRALVIGDEGEIDQLTGWNRSHSNSDTAVVSTLTPREAMASRNAIRAAVQRSDAHMVLLAPSIPFDAFRTMIFDCFACGIGVSLLPRALGSIGTSYFELRQSDAGALLHVFPMRLGVPQLAAKRALDVVLTTLVLALFWPVLAVVAVAIKIDSPGPILFRQERIGVGGRRFEIVKFRTMIVDADEQKATLQHLNEYADARLFKIKRDPRVTRLGRILRKLSIDELPQLWNVLKSDMSLVGPRPCVPEEFAQYAPHHMERLFVLPGITGPWQVNGRSSLTDFEQVVRLDREYIESWSLLKDLLILAKTLPTLLGRGAY